MDWTKRREAFRAILKGDKCIYPGSVFDPISSRMAASLGFECMMFAGSIASFTVLGLPDIALLTLTEFAEQAYRINRAGSLPLLVDADHGYGNALNVMRTVEEMETAGVAALTIEDTWLPRAFGTTKTQLIPHDELVGKLLAAVKARQDPRLSIIGRSQSLTYTGVEDAVVRAKKMAATGVDGLFFTGAKSKAHVEAIAAAVDIPIILGGVPAEMNDLSYLATQKVRITLQGHQPFLAAVQAAHDTLKALREGKPQEMPKRAGDDIMDKFTLEGEYEELSKKYLTV